MEQATEVTAVQTIAQDEQPQLNEVQSSRANSLALITNDENMTCVSALARLMAKSAVTVPKHLQGNEGDCTAVIIQATNWGMNPFAVAQKTHLVNGVLGYEAQLVNAVVQESRFIEGRFHYEYRGEGAGLACRVGAKIRGEDEVTWGEWLNSSDVTTKNSPLWKTNPKQQMGYLQVKNWARLYCPGAILGVYTVDEVMDMPTNEINQRPRNGTQAGQAAQERGNLIDPEQEEHRNTLVTHLTGFAQKGTAMFTTEWKRIGKANRNDVLLVGEAEYMRLMDIAKAVDEQYEPGSEE